MDFRIAKTFTDSLTRLTGEEQKGVKTNAFDLQLDPASPGLSFHRLDDARTSPSGPCGLERIGADEHLDHAGLEPILPRHGRRPGGYGWPPPR